ncbi:MAG TPA: hypothetical protein VJ805_00320 [Nitrospiraceae bacterium]|nr:hypothetical protein [Nitrospiraceae bacterium]
MYRRIRALSAVSLVLLLSISACGTMKPRPPVVLPSSAYFTADASELKALQALGKAHEARMKTCAKSVSVCEEAYYGRGLVALFENRADAVNIFQELHTTMPNSRYTASTLRWLNLLQDNAPASNHNSMLFGQLRQEVLHGLLDRDEALAGRRTKEQERKVAELGR